mgnify:CR=1 FL=1
MVSDGSGCRVNSNARFSNRWEIYYSIRSLKKYASWVNRIYIVTNCEVPQRILNLGVVVVSHEDIFPDLNCLPNFNSRAIESCLHKIEGLSEYFLYLNDDFILPMVWCQYFHLNMILSMTERI